VTDYDGDNVLDILTANQRTDNVTVLRGKGDGTFPAPASPLSMTYAVGSYPTALAVADLKNNGQLNIVTADRFDDAVTVLPGDNTFAEQTTNSAGIIPDAVITEDLDGDGVQDIVVANRGYDQHFITVSVMLGKGD